MTLAPSPSDDPILTLTESVMSILKRRPLAMAGRPSSGGVGQGVGSLVADHAPLSIGSPKRPGQRGRMWKGVRSREGIRSWCSLRVAFDVEVEVGVQLLWPAQPLLPTSSPAAAAAAVAA
eukprot:CAMPEP_0174730822 /NCGR_PEP_ID=MMETSP1094-20130205/56350_1 /TAXON_ID=156173 /ORGANISM="Chrysochromulina brevifilum, Strain UTEX LB 985" /LENGTH=119 /DNA_ID=CAMNT_0015933131 /DNA_START=282 /DNA_END=639 /DNA_ORIENTATION=+